MKLLAIFALICIFALVVSAVDTEEKSSVAKTQTDLESASPLVAQKKRRHQIKRRQKLAHRRQVLRNRQKLLKKRAHARRVRAQRRHHRHHRRG